MVFRHQDGIAVGPAMAALRDRGVLSLMESSSSVTLAQLGDEFGANLGYLCVPLRLLICQGWFARKDYGFAANSQAG